MRPKAVARGSKEVHRNRKFKASRKFGAIQSWLEPDVHSVAITRGDFGLSKAATRHDGCHHGNVYFQVQQLIG